MFWFYLGFITVAFGCVYALYARKGQAFAREPQDPENKERRVAVKWVKPEIFGQNQSFFLFSSLFLVKT